MKRPAVIATIVIVVFGLCGGVFRFVQIKPDRPAAFSEIPLSAGGYTGAEHFFDSVSYEVLKADTSTLRLYTGPDGKDCWLFVAYFASQKYGSQIHSPKHCLPGSGWRIETNQPYTMNLSSGVIKEMNRLVIADPTSRQLMLYWFETRGGSLHNEFALKWDLVKNAMLLRPTDAAFVRLNITLEPNESAESATRRALDFLNVFYQPVEHALPFSS
ncbi:MAG: EpsI family protein [candidate division Zixibacteria bacterium]|nr:EpsI family protein [candidate division Zixibacteria bacterium]